MPLRGQTVLVLVVCLGFSAYAALFLFGNSVLASDGLRYFCLADDAMISMRYAWNLVHGNGLVWNPGERVEGYSNLLVTLFMAVGHLLLPLRLAPLGVGISGALLCLGTAGLAASVAKRMAPQTPFSAVVGVVLLTLSYHPLIAWAFLGGDAPFVAFFLLLGFSSLASGRRSGAFPLSVAALPLIRPDALLLALALVFLKARRHERREWVPSAIALAAAVLGQLFFRYSYYGEWLPNTAVLKLEGFPLGMRLERGANYLWRFLLQHPAPVLLAALASRYRPSREKNEALFLFLTAAAAQIYIGGDYNLGWRLLAPAVPLLWVVVCASASQALAGRRSYAAIGAILAIAILGALPFESQIRHYRFFRPLAEQKVERALAIAKIAHPEATLGVFAAGMLPYFLPRLRAIDFLGKSDKRVARLKPDLSSSFQSGMNTMPGHNKYDLAYSIGTLLPTYVEDTRWGRDDVSEWAKTRYVRGRVGGVELLLKRSAPEIDWSRVTLLE